VHEDQGGPGERREVGRVRGVVGGPTLVVLGGIHGNEPAGTRAADRVLGRLAEMRDAVRGEVVFLAGNLTALRENARFIDEDLNRRWTPEKVAALRHSSPAAQHVEEREQRELLAALADIAAGQRQLYVVDLHTTSATSPPFVTVGDTLRNRRFARHLPLPLILGLEEQIDGALIEYLDNAGAVAMGVEGGQHLAPESVDNLESAIWLALDAARMLAADAVALAPHRERLQRASRGYPRVVEVRRRHPIRPGDGFRMEAGFTNFQPIRRGQLLARSAAGEVQAPEGGLLLLPLYQGLGDDGFFIAREVRPLWLHVSAGLRRLGLCRLLCLLPGVRSHPDDAGVLVVDTRVARWYPLEIFHLFGFRKERALGSELVVSRRRYDRVPPPQIRVS
jgi:succinylglutamate desuccinylase